MPPALKTDDLARFVKAMQKQIEVTAPVLAEAVILLKKAEGLKREHFDRISPKTFSGLLTGSEIEKVLKLKSISGVLLFSLYKNYRLDGDDPATGVRLIRAD